MTKEVQTAYLAARAESVYYPQPEAGILHISGPDQRDFLQRQTSNDLNALSPDRSVVTVLTSASARILDVLRVIQNQDRLRVITLPGFHARTFDYLKKRIFFMDQVEIDDLSSQCKQYDLLGPESPGILNHLGIDEPPNIDQVKLSSPFQIPATVIGQRGLFDPSYRIIVGQEDSEKIESLLEGLGCRRLNVADYQILRVEAGLAGEGAELNDQYNPLEVGLEWAVSGSKGCYTGQEVLARQITYDKVAQRMVGVRFESPPEPGWVLKADGRTVGTITSVAISPNFGPIALAVVRRSHSEFGTKLEVSGANTEMSATVTELPFKS